MVIDIVIADDHKIFREGLKQIISLSGEKRFVVKGEASSGKELVEMVRKLKPGIAITDIKMPKMTGIEATRIISTKYPKTKCIGLSMYEEESQVLEMLKAGAMGYLLKDTTKEELEKAILTVHEGNHYLHPGLANNLTERLFKGKKLFDKKVKLTPRELDVIKLICREHTNKEIANKLNLQIRTIESYRDHLLKKIDVRNTAGIVIYAIRNGLHEVN